MGWLIALAVIVLLAVLPLGVLVRYDEAGTLVSIIGGPVRIQLLPSTKKAKKEKKEKKPKAAKQPQPAAAPKPAAEQKKSGGNLADFLPFVYLVFDLLSDFRRKLRVNRLEVKLTLAGDDPCDLAVNYGRAWAALGNLEPHLDRIFVIKKKDLQVQCDFEADATKVYARLELTITLGRLLRILTCYGIRGLREYLKFRNLRKGGAMK
ncbi:MAG: DUF2953 domain-containing protein [Ruminococcaceae bacterium]|nr:DUF2953 domain-containing protein [Oscillospiraceae bacterium]